MTLDEISVLFGVDKTLVYGMVRFLEAKNLVQATGTKRDPGARGKGAKVYAFKANAAEEFAALLTGVTVLTD